MPTGVPVLFGRGGGTEAALSNPPAHSRDRTLRRHLQSGKQQQFPLRKQQPALHRSPDFQLPNGYRETRISLLVRSIPTNTSMSRDMRPALNARIPTPGTILSFRDSAPQIPSTKNECMVLHL